MVPMAPGKDGLSFGPFRLTAGERLLTRDGAPVELGARALDILIALVSTPNEVISKENLLSRVWPDVTVEESSLRGPGSKANASATLTSLLSRLLETMMHAIVSRNSRLSGYKLRPNSLHSRRLHPL
jgi:hypothetical protein